MWHILISSRPNSFVFWTLHNTQVRKVSKTLILVRVNPYFSYDGLAFRSHADAQNEHYPTSLANLDGSPLIVAGRNTKKVETYDISTNKWIEEADYPYHN